MDCTCVSMNNMSHTKGMYRNIYILAGILLSYIGAYDAAGQQSEIGLPTFITEPDNVTVEEGKTVQLLCSVDFVKQNQVVAWMKEDEFQTSGNDVLVDDKAERYSIQKEIYDDHLEFHLQIKNATYGDGGSYLCYIVEFGDLNQRRWRKSRRAAIAVIERWIKPKLRCFIPPDVDKDGFITTETSIAVGCSVREAEWSRSLVIQRNGVSVMADYTAYNRTITTLRKIRHRIRPVDGEIFEGTFTCAMYYYLRNGTIETEICTIGTLRVRKPSLPTTPQPYYADENSLWVKPMDNAKLYCPQKDAKSSDGKRLAWTIFPPLPPTRYIFRDDGRELSITNISKNDSGLLVTCVIYSEKLGRKDLETTIRVGEKPPERHGQKPRPPSSIKDPSRGGRKLVLPDMSNPDWKRLQSKWNGLRHAADVGKIHEISIPADTQVVTVVNTPVETTMPTAIQTTKTTSSDKLTPKPSNDSIIVDFKDTQNTSITGPPLNLNDILPHDIIRNEESKFGKKSSLFAGLILMCGASMITVLLLVFTVGLKCRTQKDTKEKPKPDISEPIPLSLPERFSDTTYEEMRANFNLNNFPAHCSVAGPQGATLMEPQKPDYGRSSSCNSELVFGTGSNQVDFTFEFPAENNYLESLPPPNFPDVSFDHDRLSPDKVYSDRVSYDEQVYKAEPIYNASNAYRPMEAIIVKDHEYSRGLNPPKSPHTDHHHHHQIDNDCMKAKRSSNGSDPYKFEPLQPDRQNQSPPQSTNPTFLGNSVFSGDPAFTILNQDDSAASSQQDISDPDYLPPRVTSWYYQKGSPPNFEQQLHQTCYVDPSLPQPPYGLYEVL